MRREVMEYDVVIVGAGPAGLAAAIRLKQLRHDVRVCIVEKGSAVGAHILSGAVLEPSALDELIPDWRKRHAPVTTQVVHDHFRLLTRHLSIPLPTPLPLRNQGNYIISLAHLCRWLAQQAEDLGVEIYPGFSATDILWDPQGNVSGIITGDRGLDKKNQPTTHYQPGIELRAQQTLLAEGCLGSLTKKLLAHFDLTKNSQPQTYGIGIKELWQINPKQHKAGTVIHTLGWPLDAKTYGGSFLYHLENHQVAVGFVVGLDYENPYLSPFHEFQRFKTHPAIRPTFEGGQRIAYGARALVEGGFQSIPTLTFPGGLLIGDTAGFLNVPKIKGIHTAMKSGKVAAETIMAAFAHNRSGELLEYTENIKKSWLGSELYKARNIRPAFRSGLWAGLLYAAIDTYLLHGHAPWTFKNRADHTVLKKARDCQKINYPKPDNNITFDIPSSLYLSNIHYRENQPCHLQLKNPKCAIDVNFALYDAPEQYYCPAAVYEILYNAEGQPYLQINAQNCIHCKTCDIKDPLQNINWIPPEGGDGPNYSDM